MNAMRRLVILRLLVPFLFIATLTASLAASDVGMAAADQVNQASYYDFMDLWLYTHAGDNRGTDGAEHDLAMDNIAGFFEDYGLIVTLEPFTYSSTTYYNVVGTKTGTLYPNEEYVLGAHYDSVSNPGADDNASGTALVLEAARIISQYDSDYTIRFVAFSREEQGLIGSSAYVADHAGDNILGMVAADMVAYDPGTDLARIYRRAVSPVADALADSVDLYGDGLAWMDPGWISASDHASFDAGGYDACLLIESEVWNNPYYHTQQDSFEQLGNLNFPYAVMMTRSAVGWLVDAAGVQVDVALSVTPSVGIDSQGDVGGPFSPDDIDYTLENLGDTGINYEVTKTQPWVSLTNASGYLAPLDSVVVNVSINASAEALPAGLYDDTITFTNTTNGLGNTTRDVALRVGIPQVVYEWPLDDNPGWTTEGQWAFGVPTGEGSYNGDPTSGHTGTNVYGYNLSGDYTNNLPAAYLTTETFDCTGLTDVTLKFQRWLGVESNSSYDEATIEVNNGGGWTTIWSATSTGAAVSDSSWQSIELSLASVADDQSSVSVRWGMGPTDSYVTYPGWNIDDIQIVALGGEAKCEFVADGDINGDGPVNGIDIQLFVDGILGEPTFDEMCHGDFDEDMTLDVGDIDGMVSALLAP